MGSCRAIVEFIVLLHHLLKVIMKTDISDITVRAVSPVEYDVRCVGSVQVIQVRFPCVLDILIIEQIETGVECAGRMAKQILQSLAYTCTLHKELYI